MFDNNAMLASPLVIAGPATQITAWFNISTRTPYGGIPLRVLIQDASTASATTTATITVEDSVDGSALNATVTTFPVVTWSTAGLAAGLYDEIRRVITKNNYVRLKIVTASGVTVAGNLYAGFTDGDIA